MRAAPSSMGAHQSVAIVVPSDRAEQAARLLREALTLLADESFDVPAGRYLPDRLLRLPEVQRLTGLGRSAIYQQMQEGVFPRSVKVGPRAATWSEAAVQSWIAHRLKAPVR